MDNGKHNDAPRQIKSVTNVSIMVNVILTVVKLTVGFLSGSVAVVADGVHSISDTITDMAVFFGVYFGSKKPDPEHPYGHGRIETFAGAFVALALVFVGGGMIYYAALDISKGNVRVPNIAMFIVIIGSIISKEWLYQITKKVAVKTHSSATYANAWHHRSDSLSSIAVLTGIVSIKLGFAYGDQIAGIAVGLILVFVGVNVITDCFRELSECSVDAATFEHIKSIVNANPSIHQWHNLRTRLVGREVFLDLHILVDPTLNISAAHQIAENLEAALHSHITQPTNITVHIEPDIPELRK